MLLCRLHCYFRFFCINHNHLCNFNKSTKYILKLSNLYLNLNNINLCSKTELTVRIKF